MLDGDNKGKNLVTNVTKDPAYGSVYIQRAKEKLGITESLLQAGFLLPDGDLLDLGTNPVSVHDRIAEILPRNVYDPVHTFLKLGAIRIKECGFELILPPTFEQKMVLNRLLYDYSAMYGKVYCDIANGDGEIVKTITYTAEEYRIDFWNKFNKILAQRGLL